MNLDNNLMETTLDTNNDMSGTTQILNESSVKTVTRVKQVGIPDGLNKATQVGYSQMGITDFLKKPILLQTITWNTQTAGTVLANVSLPQDAFSNPMYAKKIIGFLGFKGTAVIRVQVNGNKFMAGRLLLLFIPQGNVTGSYPGSRLRSLKAMTQLPRVELDLSTDTEVVMHVPYISPTPYYNISTQEGPIGRAVVAVYSPIATGTGSDSVDVSVWVHFEDVDLVAPAFIAQMDDRKPGKKRVNVSEEELSMFGDKPLSSGLKLMSKAASSFSAIPMLSSFAKPASWVLGALSGAASAFGYSKPTTETAVTKVLDLGNFNMQNCNGVDMWPNLGLDASNKLSILPGYAGTDIDEMTLNHLVSIPAYIASVSWAKSTASGTTLASYQGTPTVGVAGAVVNSWSTFDHTPMGYFSSFFQYWRGSIVFTIKVVKTTFHSGRLLISFNPANVAPNLQDTEYLLREIVDIRETNEFRFVVPYVATTQYKECPDISGTTSGLDFTTGIFTVQVLNELVAPDTVADTVKLLIEVSAGPDMEFACPRPYQAAPIIVSGWAAQMDETVPSQLSSSRPDQNQGLVAIGSSTIERHVLDPAEHCIGEKVNSILQLLKRYSVLRHTLEDDQFPSREYRLFTIGAAYSADLVGLTLVPTSDYVSLFAPCFAYSRGAMRLMVSNNFENFSSNANYLVYAFPRTNDDTVLQNSTILFQKTDGLSFNIQNAINYKPFGASVPAYQRLHARLNRYSSTLSNEPSDSYTSSMVVGFNVKNQNSELSTYMYRAAADDFALGYFIGVPLVTTNI